ncbi:MULTISPECIES: type II toxin-antitoxin system RelE/ParE family toxin [Serratia]|uniref:Uncharacterized protein conserved in bacteria n=1 Tax=Serratia ficaria TaxID=61651 RepID=A0A240CAS8_SERFI|nr:MULTISPECIES: type II toxin-antitoxin system RelE/ParE family toxin [Serratia]REF43311.1 hypothetical protein C7332_1554 [Serratia ficaria]CAI0698834.1 Uncharacterized protein conserved in bacteria [Serratia ficaria]CAI1065081.1 Uncharacterized protein conserved in bacteria [Serratia ficaria]CAI1120056.1 Uncharacterized protein conserved in bacteria [Serratia ficaria]CAI1155453.1 Uncharacterized protein conserved in bacteria [Serratia ficaria]
MWQVATVEIFDAWFLSLSGDQQKSILAGIFKLQEFGPQLARPYADTLHFPGSIHRMKELRIQHRGHPFRFFFAFDPQRQAVLLCGGDKTGDKRFCQRLLPIAAREFSHYLATQR